MQKQKPKLKKESTNISLDPKVKKCAVETAYKKNVSLSVFIENALHLDKDFEKEFTKGKQPTFVK